MTNAGVSIATLAPPPPPPSAPDAPALPAPPPSLRQGAAGLGPLPPPPGKVGRTAKLYLLGGVIPVVAAMVLTLVGALIPWPVPGLVSRAQPSLPLPPTVPRQKPRQQQTPPTPKPTEPVNQPGTGPAKPPTGGNLPAGPAIPEATLDAARSGRPVPVQLPGVTAPVPRSLWPGVNPGPRYAEHIADVTVTFVVLTDGRIDPASIEVSGPGAAPLKDATVAAYTPLLFQPGRVGTQVVPILMTHRYRYPPN